MTGLTIYRASAGSGKTYTLARDFINLVIREQGSFRHVLAVTFTNKATAEMKNRILDELHRLSKGENSPILEFIAVENEMSPDEVSRRAAIILDAILQNYSRFHIETIDRFFQRAIRAFTREIGLSGAYQIELDSDKVLSESIDEMMFSLEKNPQLLNWFVEFARENIREGNTWNLKRELLSLGRELNRERFQEAGEELREQTADREAFSTFRKDLMKIRMSFEGSLKEQAGQALDIMNSLGLGQGDFKGQYGVGYFFQRLLENKFREPNTSNRNAVDNPEEWYAMKSPVRDLIMEAYEKGMNGHLRECIRIFDTGEEDYLSAEAVRGYLYSLGILTDIAASIREYTESRGIFLLSDAARFLNGIIGSNDSPFIYEKIGNYFNNYMIDEFQDTSGLQWKNFRPLIQDSLARGESCLVVGDVKQSIYRWRNSDWEILSERLTEEFSQDQVQVRGLRYNWRSLTNIVSFNNNFFKEAREILKVFFENNLSPGKEYASKAGRAYDDLIQELPEGSGREGGYVRVSMLESTGDRSWQEAADKRVIRAIEELQDNGVSPSDIAILVRTGNEGRRIADAILEQKSKVSPGTYTYDVISNESLYLAGSPAVRIITGAMKFLVTPSDRVNLGQLLYDYHSLAGPPQSLDRILQGIREGGAVELPSQFMDASLRYLTLNELTERIIGIFGLNGLPVYTPYVLGFQDIVLDYCRNGSADIHSFLEWWKEYGIEKSLTVSDEQNAVKVMTIHKAKGLEFRAVIIPYCNWSMDHKNANPKILWCKAGKEPFNRMSLLPVRYGTALERTCFRQDYHEEKFRIYMDNLNLLYVAFTRARENLFIYAPAGKSGGINTVSSLLGNIIKDFSGDTWEMGGIIKGKGKPVHQMVIDSLSSHEYSGKLKLLYRGLEFFDPRAGDRMRYGTRMHEIFSRIRTSDDIDRAVESVRREGLIDSEEALELKPAMEELVTRPDVREWFDGSWNVIAEKDILTVDGTVKRPDRVMLKDDRLIVVDYKFGMKESGSHATQVRKYIDMLKEMRYSNITGFIWYVNLNRLLRVS